MATEWFFEKNGEQHGPVSDVQLKQFAADGDLRPENLVWQETLPDWQPARTIKGLFPTTHSGNPPPLPTDTSRFKSAPPPLTTRNGKRATAIPSPDNPEGLFAADSPVTNPLLPPVANAICIYAIVLSPIIWILYLGHEMAGDFNFADGSRFFGFEVAEFFFHKMLSLAVVAILFVGGLRLRELRRSGVFLVRLGICSSIAIDFMLRPVLLIFLLTIAEESDLADDTTSFSFLDFVLGVVVLCELAFMVFAMIWLYRKSRLLLLADT
jgi:hypothetical protein